MTYFNKFNKEISLDVDEATSLAVKVVMHEGELRFRELFIETLEKDLKQYLDEVEGYPNIEWVDGVRYCIHLLKNIDVSQG